MLVEEDHDGTRKSVVVDGGVVVDDGHGVHDRVWW